MASAAMTARMKLMDQVKKKGPGGSGASIGTASSRRVARIYATMRHRPDAGRTRLTFRYRTHMWSLVVKPDGTLIESAAPAAKAPPANADHLSLLDFVGTMS